MILNKTDISKFSLAEALSNSNGKTSGSKFAGFIGITVGSIGFLVAIGSSLFQSVDSVGLAGISAGVISSSFVLFGYSKNNATKDTTNSVVEDGNV